MFLKYVFSFKIIEEDTMCNTAHRKQDRICNRVICNENTRHLFNFNGFLNRTSFFIFLDWSHFDMVGLQSFGQIQNVGIFHEAKKCAKITKQNPDVNHFQMRCLWMVIALGK